MHWPWLPQHHPVSDLLEATQKCDAAIEQLKRSTKDLNDARKELLLAQTSRPQQRISILKFVRLSNEFPDLFDYQFKRFRDLPPDQSIAISSALIANGKIAVNEDMAGMTGDQLAALIAKVDTIYSDSIAARMVAENIWTIVALVRIVLLQLKGSSVFKGIMASGRDLDIWPLRARDIGGPTKDMAEGGSLISGPGLYGTGSPKVNWSWDGDAGVPMHLIPPHLTSYCCGLVIFGGFETTNPAKIDSIASGLMLQSPMNSQPCYMPVSRSQYGEQGTTVSMFQLEKPIMIVPNESFSIDIMPKYSGPTNFELIAVMCGPVQDKRL